MRPRIHVITLAVSDLERALPLYRDGLGLESPGVIGTEFAGDQATPAGARPCSRLTAGSSCPCTRAASWPGTRTSRDRPWGIYAGYFRDPDGHLWEILWNPEIEDV